MTFSIWTELCDFCEINFRVFVTPQINLEPFSSSAPFLLLFKQELKKCNIFLHFCKNVLKLKKKEKNVTSSLSILLKLV